MNRKIRIIDCNFIEPGNVSSYLIHEEGEAYFVEANTQLATPLLLNALQREDITPENVQWIVITHVHLDHAAGAYALATACPNATVLVHPRAARHLIDPEKLVSSTKKAYGDEKFARLYGNIQPIPKSRIREVADGEEILFHNSMLKCVYTRGHANHHYCLVDPVLSGIFTGDSFGVAYPRLQKGRILIFPSTSPTDFDPREAMKALDIIASTGAKRFFLSHFGELKDPTAARRQLIEFLTFSERLFLEAEEGSEDYTALKNNFLPRLREKLAETAQNAGISLTDEDWQMVETDLRCNADGIAFAGMRRRQKSA